MTVPQVSTRRAWWLATRPFSFPASIVPVLVGTAAAAETDFDLLLFVLAFVGGLLIHAGTNLATDFFDFTHGVQPTETLGGGNLRSGLLKASDVHKAAVAAFTLGSLCGLTIIAIIGWQEGWPQGGAPEFRTRSRVAAPAKVVVIPQSPEHRLPRKWDSLDRAGWR